MAKKSAARLQRDAAEKSRKNFLKTNNSWTELNQIYQMLDAQFVQFGVIGHLVSNKDLMACVDNPNALAQDIQLLASDIGFIRAELAEAYKQHEGREGQCKDENEFMRVIEVYNTYQLLAERINAVILPTYNQILERTNAAEKKLEELVKQAADQAEANAEGLEPSAGEAEVVTQQS